MELREEKRTRMRAVRGERERERAIATIRGRERVISTIRKEDGCGIHIPYFIKNKIINF